MLEEISIKNLGVIQEAKLSFTPGFTAITGETGAGKTMVLSALGLLLGKRSDASIVRHGTLFTSVEGCWNVAGLPILPTIEETGAVIEDGLIYINRTVHADGKSRAVIGGKTTPAASLALVGEGLVNIHGQSDQMRLKNPTAQREALDSYAGVKLNTKLENYQTLYNQWRTITKKVKDVQTNMVARQREYEELTHAIAEINAVQPVHGEDETLLNEANRLTNVELLKEATSTALNKINNEEDFTIPGIQETIVEVVKQLNSVVEYDEQLKELHELAESIEINLNELSNQLSNYVNSIDLDALVRLNEIQERRAALNILTRKYGPTLENVINYWQEAETKIEDLNPENSSLETLQKELNETLTKLKTQASEITQIRKKAATELSTAVNIELEGLAMAGSKLAVHVNTLNTYTNYGADEIAFMMKTPGAAEARPLAKTASGGEMSRIMLSIEVVLADPEATPTFVFDEVDSGVGGATAIEIGKRLAKLAKEAQVIVVTHLPQVAAFADNHLRVLKTNGESFVSTDIIQLNDEEKVEEIARMLSGLSSSDSGKTHALELLDMAQSYKII